MAKVTVTLEDAVHNDSPAVSIAFAIDRQGAADDDPVTEAIACGLAIRKLWDDGSLQQCAISEIAQLMGDTGSEDEAEAESVEA
jgi:hypothetical protein